jgi:hypothetical protein
VAPSAVRRGEGQVDGARRRPVAPPPPCSRRASAKVRGDSGVLPSGRRGGDGVQEPDVPRRQDIQHRPPPSPFSPPAAARLGFVESETGEISSESLRSFVETLSFQSTSPQLLWTPQLYVHMVQNTMYIA